MNQSKENQYECDVCGDKLGTPGTLSRHMELHNDDREVFKCPDCHKSYVRHYDMKDHWERKHGPNPTIFECRHCSKEFDLRPSRDSHEKRHTMLRCPRNLCHKWFATAEAAIKHAEDPDHGAGKVLYRCPISTCRLTAIGKVLKGTDLVEHWETHQKRGHVSQGKELEYIPAEQPRFNGSLPLFLAILKHSITLKDNADNLNEEHDDDDSRGLEEQENDDAVFDQDVDILRQNEEWWST
jgi:DNA-directed RNA polymerase subunit RPC12/RpoP